MDFQPALQWGGMGAPSARGPLDGSASVLSNRCAERTLMPTLAAATS